jgi:hypothetical protein
MIDTAGLTAKHSVHEFHLWILIMGENRAPSSKPAGKLSNVWQILQKEVPGKIYRAKQARYV